MVKFLSKAISNQTGLLIIVLIILLIPTFWRMLRPGIFTMHDFHPFRQFEFNKCVEDLQIPCRWSPSSAYEYGQPVFNFYTPLPYAFGQVFHLVGFSVLDTIKALFITSIIFSALGMFLLARQLWKDNFAALVSALVYTYAPYRAVDIWVRGALPEALSFVFFPLIVYFFNDFVTSRKKTSLVFFAISFSGLVLTHNLSALMFSIFLLFWGFYWVWKEKAWKQVPWFLLSGIIALGLSAFYIIPVIAESNLISLTEINKDYYQFGIHFTTLKQLLVSRFWGYGASNWGVGDDISLSIGHLHWILPLIILAIVVFKREFKKYQTFLIILSLGWLMVFLTHGKSNFLWTNLPPLQFIQFPWRFLGTAVFCFGLAAGVAVLLVKNKRIKLIIVSAIAACLLALNTGFFFEDLWISENDSQYFSGLRYKQQTSSALTDFKPRTAKVAPYDLAPKKPIFLEGSGSGELIEKRSNKSAYKLDVTSENAIVSFPIIYFPGWVGFVDGKPINIYPFGDLGLVTADFKHGPQQIKLKFTDTAPRRVGNVVSLISVLLVGYLIYRFRRN